MNQFVIALVPDMFFAAKIRGTAEQLNINVEFSRNADALIESARRNRPSLIIFDLHVETPDPFLLAERLKADEELRDIPLVGFFSHVQVKLQRRAKEVRIDRIMPRSVFSKNLSEILQGDL